MERSWPRFCGRGTSSESDAALAAHPRYPHARPDGRGEHRAAGCLPVHRRRRDPVRGCAACPVAACRTHHPRAACHRGAGPGEHAPSSLPDADPRLPGGGQRGAVRLAAHPLSFVGAARRGVVTRGGAGRDGGASAIRAVRPPRITTTSFRAALRGAGAR